MFGNASWRARLLAALAALVAASSASADPVADFYRGKTVTLTWGGSEGGSYDLYGRHFAKHATKHIPGNPVIVMRFMPGAGGTRYANYVANAERTDGTHFGIMTHNTIVYGFMNPTEVQYDTRKFNFIGSLASVQTVISVWHTKGARTIDDARRMQLTMGATGKGSLTFQDVALANNLLGTKFKVVLGYKGNNELMLAVERGEVDGQDNSWDAWATRRPHWLKEGKLVHLVQFGAKRHPDIGNVPLAQELVSNPDDKAVIEFLTSSMAIGRPVFTPAGVPADRLAALRKAFVDTMKDPDYIAEARKLQIDTGSSVGAAEGTALIAKLGAVSPAIRDRARKAIDLP